MPPPNCYYYNHIHAFLLPSYSSRASSRGSPQLDRGTLATNDDMDIGFNLSSLHVLRYTCHCFINFGWLLMAVSAGILVPPSSCSVTMFAAAAAAAVDGFCALFRPDCRLLATSSSLLSPFFEVTAGAAATAPPPPR